MTVFQVVLCVFCMSGPRNFHQGGVVGGQGPPDRKKKHHFLTMFSFVVFSRYLQLFKQFCIGCPICFCLILFFTSNQQSFGYIGMTLPGLSQY